MRIACTAFTLLLVLAGCGEGDLVPIENGEDPNGEDPGNGEDPKDPEYLLEVLSELPLSLAPDASRDLTVRLLEDGDPMPEEEVRFSVEGDAAGASLAATRSQTGPDGFARVEVMAGGEPTTFEIVVESDYTDPIEAPVEVLPPEVAPAALRVQVSYPDQSSQPVSTVTVSVFDGDDLSCEDVLADDQATAIERRNMSLTSSVVFDGLEDGQSVTVLALGSNHVAAVAEGCVEDVTLAGGEEVSVEVPLVQKDLDPTGTYSLATNLDTRGAIPGQFGSFVEIVGAMFEHPDDPARFLVNLVEEQSGVNFGFMRETAIDYLDDFIRSVVPRTFLNWFEYIGDAANVVTQMSFEGTLTIYEDDDGVLMGDELWETVIFSWRGGCNPSTNPGCDEHRIALRNTHIGEITATYEVSVDGQVLRISSHERSIQYARFFHLFLLEIVYPYIVPGASSTAELLEGAICCVSVAFYLDEADGTSDGYFTVGPVQISVDDLEQYCLTGLNFVGSMVDGSLDGLATDYENTLTLEGAAQMEDDYRDLKPEALVNGVWEGFIGVDGTDEDARGNFEAFRTSP